MYLLVNLALGGWAQSPDSSTVFPAEFRINWIRVFQLPQRGAAPTPSIESPPISANEKFVIENPGSKAVRVLQPGVPSRHGPIVEPAALLNPSRHNSDELE
jgi:hypothetical protein